MDCPLGSELTLDVLFREQLARLGGGRYPFAGSFELTERCNLACVHCYISQPAHSRTAQARELSTLQIRGIIDQVAGAGCLSLLLTGGEIFLRPDFPAIYRHALGKGLLLTLFTNGTLLTPRMADLLAEWRPQLLEITLYGMTQETYERVTGVRGSHVRCMRGIELALHRGLPLALKAVVLRANRQELEEMKAFAGGLGVEFRYDGVLWPRVTSPPPTSPSPVRRQERGSGGEVPLAQRLSPQEIVALDGDDPERAREWRRLAVTMPEMGRGDLVFACGAGRRGFHIDCTGRLSPCIMARAPAFNLLEDSFGRAWEGLGPAIAGKRKAPWACPACRAAPVCTQCAGWSQLVHRDNETPVAFVCELAHLRAARFGAHSS